MFNLFNNAYAMSPQGTQGGSGGGNIFTALIPFVLIFVVFYFLLIRPQQKRAKKHQEFLSNLNKGDNVITTGGIYGKIVGLTDAALTLEISENVRIKVARAHVAGKAQDDTQVM